MILVNKHAFNSKLLHADENFIFIELQKDDLIFIIGCVYVSPLANTETVFSNLDLIFNFINLNYDLCPVIIGGDFNGRIGNLNQIDKNVYISPFICNNRNCIDKTKNARGELLTELMESKSLFVLNGRTIGDENGCYTYTGTRGSSTADTIWASFYCAEFIRDMEILTHMHASDHFPLYLKLSICNPDLNRNLSPSILQSVRYKWTPEKSPSYRDHLQSNVPSWEGESNVDTLNDNLYQAIVNSATDSDMQFPVKQNDEIYTLHDKPWYDAECKTLKRELNTLIRRCKKRDFPSDMTKIYTEKRNAYNKIEKLKQKQYYDNVVHEIVSTKSSKAFWKAINLFIFKSKNKNLIQFETWYRYLKNLYSCDIIFDLYLQDIYNPILDTEISLEEVQMSLRKCKKGKAPGFDGLSSEFFQNLPDNWLHYVTHFFNSVLLQERIPSSWGIVVMTMLHKKGDPLNPNNYRSIALVGSLVKIFTQILCLRLQSWAEDSVLNEFQTGFRRNRGCLDNIFTLNSLIQIQFNKNPSRKVFALFIDFSKAFDSVNHNLLWNKLSAMGVSSKFIRIFKDLYEKATIRVRNQNAFSDPIDIDIGVLQGEILSPLLFALFLNDLETYLRDNGCYGVSVNQIVDILLLAYADDIVITVEFSHMLIRVLKHLYNYCSMNQLNVNLAKTNVVIFRKGGGRLSKKIPSFFYGGEQVLRVKEYEYLGIIFSESGKFRAAMTKAVSSTRNAMCSVRKIIEQIGLFDWDTVCRLLDSLSLSVLLYAAQVWAMGYLEEVDNTQTGFFKQLLNLPANTPSYAVRLETGRPPINFIILKQAFNWSAKVLLMNDSRYPKICFVKLRTMALTNQTTSGNWFAQINDLISACPASHLWSHSENSLSQDHINTMFTQYRQICFVSDSNRLRQSTSLQILATILPTADTTPYLLLRLPLHDIRVLAQLRFLNNFNPRIITDKICKFNYDEKCRCCTIEVESLSHFLHSCDIYRDLRQKLFNDPEPPLDFWTSILTDYTQKSAKKLVRYVRAALSLREKF